MALENEALEVFQKNLLRMVTTADDSLTDISLHIGRQGSQSSVINCHRVILAAQSPVFAQLFQQAMSGNKVWASHLPYQFAI
jgi:hypothetical protein